MSNWYALTVRPQHERAAAMALGAKGMDHFLPLYRARRRWSDRVKELELPLFPGYVFCRLAPADRARALATPSVTSVVGFGNAPAPISEEELNAIRTMLGSRLPVGPWPYLKVGQPVRFVAGPLKGLQGILVQLKDDWRVVASVHLLQRSVAVEVDRDVLAALQPLILPPAIPATRPQVSARHF